MPTGRNESIKSIGDFSFKTTCQMNDNQSIEQSDNKYFSMWLNIYDDIGLDVYEYRLLGHYHRVGRCYKSVRRTAKDVGFSVGKVIQSRDSLEKKGLIKTFSNDKDTITIKVLDWMPKNIRHCESLGNKNSVSPHEHSVSPHEHSVSPHEHKKNKLRRPIEEYDISPSGDVPDVTSKTKKQSEPSGTKKKFIPPTKEEVEEYFAKSLKDPEQCKSEASDFITYFEASGWKMANGKKVKIWRQNAATWIKNLRDSGRIKETSKPTKSKQKLWQGIPIPPDDPQPPNPYWPEYYEWEKRMLARKEGKKS